MERSSCIGQMLAMIRRYGSPSIFLTVAPDDVMEVVIGTPFVNSDKTTKSLHELTKGVFGRGIASFGVTEETGKGTHHLHSVGWCGAPRASVSESVRRGSVR